jgi:hypothetical protein
MGQLRSNFVQHIQNVPQQSSSLVNVTTEELSEIKTFQLSDELMIQATDKNLGLIVLSKEWYKKECQRQLSDTTVYRQLTREEYIGLLADLHGQCKFICENLRYTSENLRKYLFDTYSSKKAKQDFRFCTFYILPKIHKPGEVKGRPICSNTHFVTHAISTVVDTVLQPYVQATPSYIKDSISLVRTLETLNLPSNTPITLFAMDVVSLYPSIPTADALQRIQSLLLAASKSQSETQKLQEIHKLLTFVMKNNFLMFDGSVYQQIQGTSMGTSSAPAFACLFMAQLEQTWIDEYSEKLLMYKRFIDDGFGVFLGTESETKTALEKFNNLHPNIKIDFNFSIKSVVFLDLNIYINPNFPNKLQVSCFQKLMNKYLYLPFTSYHNDSLKQNFIRGELIRYLRNCSEEENFKAIKIAFFGRLRARGYPSEFLLPIFLKIQFEDRKLFLSPKLEIKQQFSESQPILIQEKNPISENAQLHQFFRSHWFQRIIPVSDQSEEATFLRKLSRPRILTKYPPNLRQLLIRSEFNGFVRKPKSFWSALQQPKHLRNPFEDFMEPNPKKFKPPPPKQFRNPFADYMGPKAKRFKKPDTLEIPSPKP